MKRCAISREELAIHEAGHLVAITVISEFEPGDFLWRRLPAYEIAHVEPVHLRSFDWESPDDRNALIVRRVVVALAGGAAATVLPFPEKRQENSSLEAIHESVGKIDFELAHEWLTLQRYDPDQRSLELELKRLFFELCDVLDAPAHRAALVAVSRRLLEHLSAADATGENLLRLPARLLLGGIALVQSADFTLKSTLLNKAAERR
jgi:hypothetical protein